MIYSIPVDTQDLQFDESECNEIRPECPCGSKKVWGHGFRERWINETLVKLRRYFFPKCQKVFQSLPRDVWPFQRFSVSVIYEALVSILTTHRWPKGVPRQRGGHWSRKLSSASTWSSTVSQLKGWMCEQFEQRKPFFILSNRAKLLVPL
jgi:hypothetical protein